jgi:hypothetical protein
VTPSLCRCLAASATVPRTFQKALFPEVFVAFKQGEPPEKLSVQTQQVRAVMARLLAGLPAEEIDWTAEHRASWLLAHMLEYHRREDKSSWWKYFSPDAASALEQATRRDVYFELKPVLESLTVRRSLKGKHYLASHTAYELMQTLNVCLSFDYEPLPCGQCHELSLRVGLDRGNRGAR